MCIRDRYIFNLGHLFSSLKSNRRIKRAVVKKGGLNVIIFCYYAVVSGRIKVIKSREVKVRADLNGSYIINGKRARESEREGRAKERRSGVQWLCHHCVVVESSHITRYSK